MLGVVQAYAAIELRDDVVRAYPLGNPGAGLVGMPGTFILGPR